MTGIERREFVKGAASVAVGLAGVPTLLRGQDDRMARLGLIGIGDRGTGLLDLMLRRPDTTVNAICDVDPEAIARGREQLEASGASGYGVYDDGEHAFERMVERDDLDAVVIATPWEWHTPMALAAMRAGKWAASEVPAAVTLEECWELVETSQETGIPCSMLENVCYRRDVMAVMNMVRDGLFGELIHLQCGYQHDLRFGFKFRPGVEFGANARGPARWRTQHSVTRNGDVYPTHGAGPAAMFLDINYGNRFVTLTSAATKARGLHQHIVEHGGPDHPNAAVNFKLGDVVTTTIHCSRGETLLVVHDTNLPRPYSLNFRVQGTKGIWMDDLRSVYIEGRSPEAHRWEPFASYQEEFDHGLWRRYADDAQGAGHGGMDFFVLHGFIESVKRRVPPPMDVYDAATWSAISALSEQSIAMGGHPVAFPDFTAGLWANRQRRFGVSDAF
jgi:predicted dehydrogenase